jgi:hypothetical protein
MAEPDERPISGETPPDDSVSLTITMASKDHSVSDVRLPGRINRQSRDGEYLGSVGSSRPAARLESKPREAAPYLDRPPSTKIDLEYEFDPFSPFGAGFQAGMNTTLRHLIRDNDPELYTRLFSFARVRRLEHHSPLLFETMAVIGVAAALPAILLYGCFWAVYYARRTEAEIRIRETEAELKQEELKQSRLRSQVQEHMANAIKRAGFSSEPLRIPEAALAEAARVITPTVSDLGKSPLIGSLTIGLSKGK